MNKKFEVDILSASNFTSFGFCMSSRKLSTSSYRYSFQGQEVDREWLEGAVSFNYRVHDVRIGRFLSVDPLTRKYPYWTPYAFSGNRLIDAIEIEGLEPAPYKEGAKHLVIIDLGYGGTPDKGKTQSQNGMGDEVGGLSTAFQIMALDPEIQLVVFNSSISGQTLEDIAQTVTNFQSAMPNGTVSVVGHSMGADELMTTIEKKDIKVDLFVALDLSAGPLNDNETVEKSTDVNLVIGFYQTNDTPGGNIIDSNNDNATVVNYQVNSTHTSIDQDMGVAAATLVQNKIDGSTNDQLIKEAQGLANTFNKLGTTGAPTGTVPAK